MDWAVIVKQLGLMETPNGRQGAVDNHSFTTIVLWQWRQLPWAAGFSRFLQSLFWHLSMPSLMLLSGKILKDRGSTDKPANLQYLHHWLNLTDGLTHNFPALVRPACHTSISRSRFPLPPKFEPPSTACAQLSQNAEGHCKQLRTLGKEKSSNHQDERKD